MYTIMIRIDTYNSYCKTIKGVIIIMERKYYTDGGKLFNNALSIRIGSNGLMKMDSSFSGNLVIAFSD